MNVNVQACYKAVDPAPGEHTYSRIKRNEVSRALGDEAFYIDEHGRKSDAAIHQEILAGVDSEADKRHRLRSARHMIKRGFDPAAAARIAGSIWPIFQTRRLRHPIRSTTDT